MRLLVGTFTAHRFGDRRKLCRETWWHDAERFPEVERFWVAGAEGKVSQPWRIDEWLFLPVPDAYETLIWRTQELCRWALTQGDFDYLIKCDDDTLILWDRFLPIVREHLAAGHDYVGTDFHAADISRSFAGACYLLSPRAVKIVADDLHNHNVGGEDGSVGETMTAAGVPHSREDRLGLPTPWPQNRWIPTPDNDLATLNALAPYDGLWGHVWRDCGKPA